MYMLAETLITPSQVYWITRCDAIKDMAPYLLWFTLPPLIFCAILMIISLITGAVAKDERREHDVVAWWKRAKFYAILVLIAIIPNFILVVGMMAVPTTKEMAAIYVIPAVVNNPAVQQTASDALVATKEGLKDASSEFKDLYKLAKGYMASKIGDEAPAPAPQGPPAPANVEKK